MRTVNKISIGILLFVAASAAFLCWYAIRYSMDKATPFEVNDPSLDSRILIATQGSAFKDSLVSKLVDTYRNQPVYLKIIDVEDLDQVNEDEWNVIVLIHTWENFKPPAVVSNFVKRSARSEKIFAVTTSGSHSSLEGVDGYSAASNTEEIVTVLNAVKSRLDTLIPPQ